VGNVELIELIKNAFFTFLGGVAASIAGILVEGWRRNVERLL